MDPGSLHQASPRADARWVRPRAGLADPDTWALALAGWLVRGGLLIVLLPLLTLPSPVGLSVLVGPDIVDATGLSTRIRELLAVAAAVAALLLVLALLASAWVQRTAWERRQGGGWEAEPDGSPGLQGSMGGPAAGGVHLAGLVAISIVALVPLGAAVALAADQIVTATTAELIFPSRLDVPLVLRVVEAARGGVALVAGAVFLADLIDAVGSRRLLLSRSAGGERRLGRSPISELTWAVRHPLRLLGAAVLGWVVTLLAAGPTVVGLSLAWSRLTVLANVAGRATDPAARIGSVLAFVLGVMGLVALLGLAFLALAVAAVIRSRLWDRAVLGGGGPGPVAGT